VSKILLNLLVEIIKVLPNSKIYLNSKIKTFIFFLYQPSRLFGLFGPTDRWPLSPPIHRAGPPLPQAASLHRLRRPNLCCIPENTLSSLIHALCPRRLLSLPSLTHGPRLPAFSPTPRWLIPGAPPPNPATSGLPVSP
jgi:hypothetical protein